MITVKYFKLKTMMFFTSELQINVVSLLVAVAGCQRVTGVVGRN